MRNMKSDHDNYQIYINNIKYIFNVKFFIIKYLLLYKLRYTVLLHLSCDNDMKLDEYQIAITRENI